MPPDTAVSPPNPRRKLIIITAIHTLICVLGFFPAMGLTLMFVMGGAAASGETGLLYQLGMFIALVGYVLPAGIVISVIGAWIFCLLNRRLLTLFFCALPWAHLLVLVAASIWVFNL